MSKTEIHTVDDMDVAAKRILAMGCNAVLIKGGHLEGNKKIDQLYLNDGTVHSFVHATINTRNTHGTGCTLSSAIASFMARGLDLPDAIAHPKEYLSQAL